MSKASPEVIYAKIQTIVAKPAPTTLAGWDKRLERIQDLSWALGAALNVLEKALAAPKGQQ
jgi:hypothetical protein